MMPPSHRPSHRPGHRPGHRGAPRTVACHALAAAVALGAGVAQAQPTPKTLTVFGSLGAPGWQQGVTRDSAGNLFTVLSTGTMGAVVEVPAGTTPATPIVLHSFTGGADGANPAGSLSVDAAGNLYGVTQAGPGTSGGGTVYKLTRTSAGYTETVLHSFTGAGDGRTPLGGVVLDSAGNLYGTTSAGAYGYGTVYMISPPTAGGGAWTTKPLYAFRARTDGAYPAGMLLRDSLGTLFGTTTAGGGSGAGTVFRLAKSGAGYSETVLHAFGAAGDGAAPQAGLAMDGNGNLYGTTYAGGTAARGTVFMLSPPASGTVWSERVLYRFTGGADGSQPIGGVAMSESGSLYGTTGHGGANGTGVVFKLSPAGATAPWTDKVLFSFPALSSTAAPGSLPTAGLLLTAAGILYGTTSFGGGTWHTGGMFSIGEQ